MLQLMFDFEKDSEADAKTAISFAPAATAASKPYQKIQIITNIIIGGRKLKFLKSKKGFPTRTTYFHIRCQYR